VPPEKVPTPTPPPIPGTPGQTPPVLANPGGRDIARSIDFTRYLNLPPLEQSLDTDGIQDLLRRIARETGRRPAVLYVDVFEKRTELVLVALEGEPSLAIVPEANREALLARVREFRSEVLAPNRRNSTSYLPAAQKLHSWLIEPIEQELRRLKIDTLGLVLDRGLRHVPMAALHDGKQFLVEKYNLTLIPSVNLIDPRFGDVRQAKVLAMGASEFADDEALPAVPTELSVVAKQAGDGRFFLNRDFTLSNLRAQREQKPFGIIHLATHADFNSGPASNSFVKLSDTRLGLDQMRQLKWNDPPVELLVLSACRTALGDENAELGFAGLAVAAGVKTAVASLWYTSDTSALAVMTQLYEQLKSAPIKAEALRAAQLDLIQGRVTIAGGELRTPQGNTPLPPELKNTADGSLVHPYYWSGFTVVGSPW